MVSGIFWGIPKKDRRQKKRSRTLFPTGRFARMSIEIRRGQDLSAAAMGFLHDLSPEGIGLFVEKKLEINDSIELVLPVPDRLCLRGRIAWCKEVPSFRILKLKRLPYRIGVQFQFTSADDRQALELICANLAVRRFRGSLSP